MKGFAAEGTRGRKVLQVVLPIAVAGLLILIWDIIALTAYAHRAYLLPDPAAVAVAGKEHIGLLLHATWDTFIEAGEGLVLGVLVGMVLASLMSVSRLVGDALYPVGVVFQTVPVIAVAPILVLLFHYGRTAIIIMVILVTFFPVLSNVYSGLRATNPNHAELFALYHANLWTTFWKLRFPQALPAAFNGLRISGGLAVVGATVGEFLIGETGGRPGLGVLLITTQEQVDASLLFATAAFATALAIAFFLVVNRAAKLVLRHRSDG